MKAMKPWQKIIMGLAAALVLFAALLLIPAIRNRIFSRLENAATRIEYAVFKPTEVVFVPEGGSTPQATPTSSSPDVLEVTPSVEPTLVESTPTPAVTVTPLPTSVVLEGVRYEDQHGLWNYCAPATLSMGLSYWQWEGDRTVTGQAMKPTDQDLNVMPYEMVDFVEANTELDALWRYGGTLDLLKRLVAAGYPVVIEKGALIRETTSGQITWMGHYNLVVGYDDATSEIIVRDSYYSPPDYPLDYRISYEQLTQEWRGFNYVFVVIYPPADHDKVVAVLGDYANDATANAIAAQKASEEIDSLGDPEKLFAWYNRGTSLVALQDYAGAASAYDAAFNYLAGLSEDIAPKKVMRLVWYQTGPYFAYYYSGRYQDMVNLADKVLAMPSNGPNLEESLYWRAMAKRMMGDTPGAVADLQASLVVHPEFGPSVNLLQELGY